MTEAEPKGKRGRRVAMRTATAIAAVLVAVGLWELGALLWPSAHALENPWYTMTSAEAMIASDDLPFERPPHFSWTGSSRGDLAYLWGDRDPYAHEVTFQTDFQGFRNSRDIRQADVVFIGDSYTEAGNVDEAETFPRLVGERLGVSVRNLGRAVYAPPHELAVLRKYALPCEPKLVVWQLAEANDLAESLIFQQWREAGRPYLDLTGIGNPTRAAAWKSRSFVYRLWRLVKPPKPYPLTARYRTAAGEDFTLRFLPETFSRDRVPGGHAGTAAFVSALREGAALLRERGIPLIVVYIPMKYRAFSGLVSLDGSFGETVPMEWDVPPEETLGALVHQLCRELDVPLVDTTQALRVRAAAGELVFLPYDTHLSPRGHAVVADLIAEAIGKVARDK